MLLTKPQLEDFFFHFHLLCVCVCMSKIALFFSDLSSFSCSIFCKQTNIGQEREKIWIRKESKHKKYLFIHKQTRQRKSEQARKEAKNIIHSLQLWAFNWAEMFSQSRVAFGVSFVGGARSTHTHKNTHTKKTHTQKKTRRLKWVCPFFPSSLITFACVYLLAVSLFFILRSNHNKSRWVRAHKLRTRTNELEMIGRRQLEPTLKQQQQQQSHSWSARGSKRIEESRKIIIQEWKKQQEQQEKNGYKQKREKSVSNEIRRTQKEPTPKATILLYSANNNGNSTIKRSQSNIGWNLWLY